ncbi:hypothetical protein ACFX2H_026161 [Malus domestica]
MNRNHCHLMIQKALARVHPTNTLLLDPFCGSDNGTRVLTSVMGTAGYLDPDFTGQPATIESDDLVHIVEWVNPEFLQRDFTTIL